MTNGKIVSTQVRSKYQDKTLSLQHSSRKQKGSMLGRGIGLMAGGVIMGLVVAVLAPMLKGQNNLMVGGAGLLALGFFFYGIFMIFQAIFSKSRNSTCPYCSAKYNLFHSAKSYVCTQCSHVLRFAGSESELVKGTCPHCELEWAASPNSGATRCFCCGARLTITNGVAQFSPDQEACPSCGAANPIGSYFCWKCGAVINTPEPVKEPEVNLMSESTTAVPNSEGMDFISIRAVPPIGLLFNAISRLNAVIPIANALPEENYLDTSLVREIEYSLEGIEEALNRCPDYAGLVRDMLPGVTRLTARLIKGAKVGSMPYSGTDGYNTFWRELSGSYNRLTSKSNPGVNLTLQKIGWPSQLVKVSRGGTSGNYQPPQFATIIDNESDIKEWVKLHLPNGPIEPLAAPISKGIH